MSVSSLLLPVLRNIEERGDWVSGRLVFDPSLFVEVSLENAISFPRKYWIRPSIPIIYFGMHGPKHFVAEFVFGQWPHRPLDPLHVQYILRVIAPLHDYPLRLV